MPGQFLQIQSLQLQKHYRHRYAIAISSLLPAALVIGLGLAIDRPFFGLVSLLFIGVGLLNLLIMESRTVPGELFVSGEYLRFDLRGETRQYSLQQITVVREIKITLRTRQHILLEFADGTSLPVYAYAMRLISLNNQPVEFRLTDLFHPSWRIWDRAVGTLREFLRQNGLVT